MNKSQALYNFFSSFDISAFPTTAVPESVSFPWLSYENKLGNTRDSVSIAVYLYYHTDSEAVINAKVDEIAQRISLGGTQIAYDGGAIWVKMGTPYSVPIVDNTDHSVKRRMLNITLEFM